MMMNKICHTLNIVQTIFIYDRLNDGIMFLKSLTTELFQPKMSTMLSLFVTHIYLPHSP